MMDSSHLFRPVQEEVMLIEEGLPKRVTLVFLLFILILICV